LNFVFCFLHRKNPKRNIWPSSEQKNNEKAAVS